MVELDVTIGRSDHPDDDRITEPVECRIDVDVVPRKGEVLELPWPLDADTPGRAKATVVGVWHTWIEGDLIDVDGRILVLRTHLTAKLWAIDLDQDW